MTPAQARIIAVLGLLVSAVAVTTAVVFYVGDREAGAVRSAAARPTVVVTAVPATTTSPSAQQPAEYAAPSPTRTTTATATPATTRSAERLSVRATSAVNVRSGPGTQYDVIGVFQPPDEAHVTGRNADASWLAIEHAGGTGWVSAGVVEVVGDPLRAPLVEPAPPRTATPAAPTPAATPVPTRSASSTPAISSATATPAAALPDLVPLAAAVNANGRVTVTIGNAGQGPLMGRNVSIVGVDAAGNVLFSQLTAPLTIAPGAAVTVELSYRPPERMTVTIVLNAEGSVLESNANNNLLRVTLSPP